MNPASYSNNPGSWNQGGSYVPSQQSMYNPQNTNSNYSAGRPYDPSYPSHSYQNPNPPGYYQDPNPRNYQDRNNLNRNYNYDPRGPSQYDPSPNRNYPGQNYPQYNDNYQRFQSGPNQGPYQNYPQRPQDRRLNTEMTQGRNPNYQGDRSHGFEAASTNNYNFYKSLDPRIETNPMKIREELSAVREPTQGHFDSAERKLADPPMPSIIENISMFVLKLGIIPQENFIFIDQDRRGVVGRREFFGVVVEKWGLIRNSIVAQDEIEMIADIFDFFESGVEYYIEFCKKITNPDYRLGGEMVARRIDPEWRERMYKIIAADVYKAKIHPEEILSKMDETSNGNLSLRDFVKGIRSLTNKLNPQEVLLLADEFDYRHDGIINYQRFCSTLEAFIVKKLTYENTLNSLAQFCSENSISLESRMAKVDPRNKKQVNREDFVAVLRQVGFDINFVDLQVFCDEILHTKDGLLDLRFVYERLPSIKENFDLSIVYSKIRDFIRERRQNLADIFKKFDKNGDGSLGFYEFSQALGIMGLEDLTAREISLLIQDLDTDHDGSISLTEFADKLSMSIDLLQTSISLSFFRKIRSFLLQSNQRLEDFFRSNDYNNNRSLSKREFLRMLSLLKLDLRDNDIDDLFHEIDSNRDEQISFSEFAEKYNKTVMLINQRDGMNKAKVLRAMKSRNVKDVFAPTYDGRLGLQVFLPESLSEGLHYLQLGLTGADVDYLVEEIIQSKGYAELDDILVFLGLKLKAATSFKPTQEPPQPAGPHWAGQHLKQIKAFCTSKSISLLQLISSYNSDRSGRLTVAEFMSLVKDCTTGLNRDDQFKLTNELKKEGRIIIAELIQLIEGVYSCIDTLTDVLTQFFVNYGKKIREIFKVDKNGDIYRKDLNEGFAIIDSEIDTSDILEFMTHLNPEIKNMQINNPNHQKISANSLAALLNLQNEEVFESPRANKAKLLQSVYDLIAEHVVEFDLNLERIIGEEFDKFGTNKIKKDDFLKLVVEITENGVSQNGLLMLVTNLDKLESGVISYPLFLGKLEDCIIFKNFSERFFVGLKRQVADTEVNLNSIFRDSAGFYTFSEILQGLSYAGLFVDKEELRKICQKLDYDDIGKVQWREFVEKVYSSGLQKRIIRKKQSKKEASNKFVVKSHELTPKDSKKGKDKKEKSPKNELQNISNPFVGKADLKPIKPQLRGPKQHWAYSYTEAIKFYASQQQKTLKQVFQEFDLDRSNSLSKSELIKALYQMEVPINIGEIENLMEELDLNGDGRVSLSEFEKIAGDREVNERIEQVLEDIRVFVFKNRVNLRYLFMQVDKFRSNYLTYDEIIKVIESFYSKLTKFDLQDIARYLDIDRDGKLFYYEFIGRMLIDEIEKLNKKVYKFIKKHKVEAEEIFKKFDARQDKCLSFDLFLRAFDEMKLPISRDDQEKIIFENPLHRTKDNRYSYEDLLETLGVKNTLQILYEALKKHLTDRQIKIKEVFRKLDIYNEEALIPEVFKEVFFQIKFRINSGAYSKLVNSLKKTLDGKVKYKSFLKKLKNAKKANFFRKDKEGLYKRLRTEIENRGISFYDHLKSMDTYGDKLILRSNLKDIFISTSIPIAEDDLDTIWHDLDRDEDGLINYEDLYLKINPKSKQIKGDFQILSQKQSHWAQKYLSAIESYLKSQQNQVKDLFTLYDKDHSNSISTKEFTEAILSTRVNIPENDLRRLCNEVIDTKTGFITLTAFESLFPEYIEQYRKVEKLMNLLRQVAKDRKVDLESVFVDKDYDLQGSISVLSFLDCIRELIPGVSSYDLRTLADYWDYSRSNRINYPSFIEKINEGTVYTVNIKAKSFFRASKISFSEAFKSSLKDNYFLDPMKIRIVLEGLKIPLTSEELTMLIHDNNLLKGPDGKLSVRDLADRIGIADKLVEPQISHTGVFERMQELWQTLRINPLRIFQEFDYERDLHLSQKNFSQALIHARCPLTPSEIEAVWGKVDKSRDNRISVEHFIRLVNGIVVSCDAIFYKVYVFCSQNKLDLESALAKVDSSRDGKINLVEMEKGLKNIRVVLTDFEYASVFAEVDKGRSGKIFITDFVRRVFRDAPKINLSELHWAAPIFSSIYQYLDDVKTDAYTFFKRFNLDLDGFITLDNFFNALYKIGIDPQSNLTQKLVNCFKVPSRDSIIFKEFEFALKNLSSMKTAERSSEKLKILSQSDLKNLYECFDYIGNVIKQRKMAVPNYLQKKFGNFISFLQVKQMVKGDLGIDSDDEVLNDLCLLLDVGKGFVERGRLADALMGIKITQIIPEVASPQKIV